MQLRDLLRDVQTPALVLDEAAMLRNVARLDARLARLGVRSRPHLKTVKSVEAARPLLANAVGGTVSTLREAEVFAAAGVRDIVYAVGIAPAKLDRVLALRAAGCNLTVILDSVEQAHAVAQASRESGTRIPARIEIDSDGLRAGLAPDDPAIVAAGRALVDGGAELAGVLTHNGGSYAARGDDELRAAAARERDAVVAAATMLRDAGLPCPVVSVGSTPTAHFAEDLTGVTEVRAGVHVFHDLVMDGLGVCRLDDIAISVLATVIGHRRDKGWILVDAGWMAMSRDRGTAAFPVDQGYGLVCDVDGRPYGDLILTGANQEHGIAALRPGSTARLPDLPVGTQVRILPNHACATAAQFDGYHVIRDGGGGLGWWPRFGGW